jgi:ABC-type transporter Mla subunit MlaD
MKLERDDAKIGLLVFLSLALFLGFLFQRSVRAMLKKEFHLQVALANASDVVEGTEVQLQGLRVGQVEAVQLTRDGVTYGFLANLGLREDIVLWQGTRALVVAKPLGGAYVDLLLPAPSARVAVLAPGSVLAGATGPSLATLVEGVDTLVHNLNRGVDEVRGQLDRKGLGALLDQPQVAKVLTSLQTTLQAFQDLARDSRGLVQKGEGSMAAMDRSLTSLDKSLAQVQALLDNHAGDLDTIIRGMAGTLKEMEILVREANVLLQKAGPSGSEAVQALERNLRSTEELLELLKAKPNRVVWGKPTAAEREAAAKRVDEARKQQAAKP